MRRHVHGWGWLVGMLLAGTATAGGGSPALTPGWDSFGPLTSGSLTWSQTPGGYGLDLTYTLGGALTNHEFTAGMHFFDVNGFVDFGLGFLTGPPGVGPITREGHTSVLSATDLGFFSTDGSGNGVGPFLGLTPNLGIYAVQLNLREGGAPGCPSTSCNAIYRTGGTFSTDLVRFTVPAATSFWSADDGNATDEMGVNPGTPMGSVAYRAGEFRNGFDFDGSTWVSIPNPVAGGLASATGFTVIAWIQQDTFASTASIFNVRTSANASGFTLEPLFQTPETMVFAVNTTGLAEGFSVITGKFPVGVLQRVAATFDAATHTMRLYRDGLLVAEKTDVPGTTMSVIGTEEAAIGRNIVSDAKFDGLVDEVLYYPRALTAAEIGGLVPCLFCDEFDLGNTNRWSAKVP